MSIVDQILGFFKTPIQNESSDRELGIRATIDDTVVSSDAMQKYIEYNYRYALRNKRDFIIENMTRNQKTGGIIHTVLHIPSGERLKLSPTMFTFLFEPQGLSK